jgi:hypothetical protein
LAKLKVQLAKLGNLNTWLDVSKVSDWKSALFEVLPEIDQYRLPTKAAGLQWDFLDDQVSRALPKKPKGDFLLVLTDSPLEGNYYMRRLPGNRVCISFFQIRDILAREDIPLENYVLKCIYEVLIYYTIAANHGGQLPNSEESYTHDETKGCLFDMAGNKTDIVVSCRAPILCDTCYADLPKATVPTNFLDEIRRELRNVRLSTYAWLLHGVKRHPVLSILITAASGLLLNILADLITRLF